MDSSDEKPRTAAGSVYRNYANRRLVVVISVVTVLVLLGGAVAGPSPDGPSSTELWVFSVVLASVFVGLIYWRAYRAGAYARDRDILVVNVCRTHRIPWDEIRGFAVGSSFSEYRLVYLERVDGSRVPIAGTAGWAPFFGQRLAHAPDGLADQLNALLRDRRRLEAEEQT